MVNEDKWKEAVKDNKTFSDMLELIKRFPIKPLKEVKCLPYEIEKPIQYQPSLFWN